MRLRPLPALAPALVLLCLAPSAGATPLVGSSKVPQQRVSVAPGSVEAVPLMVRRSGSLRTLRIWVDRHTRARKLVIGIYSDRRGRPGRLLARGHRRKLRRKAWNTVPVPATPVMAGERVWVAIAPAGGSLTYRAEARRCTTASTTVRSTSLPTTWTGATAARRRCAPSVGGDGQPTPPVVPVIPPIPPPVDPAPPVDPVPPADTTPPETTIDVAPPPLTTASSTSIAFSSEAGATFECRLDGGAWQSCASPYDLAGLADGAHTFDVRAIDQAGNTDPTPASAGWTVDMSAPGAPSISSGPSGLTNSTAADFAFTGESGDTFECRLDGGSWAACDSPRSYTGLAAGMHTFDVRATDGAGNRSAAASRSWVIDTTAPGAPSIASGPSGTTSSTSASLAFSAESGASLECRLDGGAWAACTSPQTYASLTDGSHTFDVRARDAAGNTGAAATRTWTVDTVAPGAPSISSGPSGPTSSTSASLAFSGETGASFECRIDGGAWAACTSPKAYSSLAQGSHTFDVRARDAAGNTGAATTRTWTVDTTAPDTTLVSGPSGTTTSTSATLTFSSEAGASFQCRIDGGAWGACTSPKTWSGLAVGAHTAEVRASDAAGNTDATPASASWTVQAAGDTTPPTVSWTKPANGQTISGTLDDPTCEAAASDAGGIDRIEFYADGTLLNTERTAPYTCTWDTTKVSNGSHTLRATAYDAAGNSRSADITVTVSNVADTTPPDTTIDSGPSGTSSSASASFGFSASEAGSTFQCRLDGSAWAACSSPKAYASLADGSHTFDVRATDAAGNTDGSPASRTWTVDTSAPPAGADLYMSPSGSDSNPCTDSQPCKTMTGTAAKKSKANVTISMKPGTYAGQTVNTGSSGDCTANLGNPSATTNCRRFVAQPGVRIGNLQVSGSGTWVTAANRGDLLIDGAYSFGGTQDVIENAIIDPGDGDPGVYLDHVTDFTLTGSEVKGVTDNDGVDVYGGATGSLNTRILNNEIHDVNISPASCQHTDGVQVAGTSGPGNTGTQIRNNHIYDIDQNADIQLDSATSQRGTNEIVEGNNLGTVNYVTTSCVPTPYPRAITLSGINLSVRNNTAVQPFFVYPGSGSVTGNRAPQPQMSGASCSTYAFSGNVWSANPYGTSCP